MALSSTKTALAIKTQSVAGTFVQPSSSADTYPCANLKYTPQPITFQNPEYLGTVHAPGDIIMGAVYEITFEMMLRPPGGAAPPSAGDFIPGRLLTAAGFTENILSAAIPTSAEAIGVGSTTSQVVLGTTAAATNDLYNGLALWLSDNGTTYANRLTAIRDYTSAKAALMFEVLSSAPAANYQIPKQLAYQYSSASPSSYLSLSVWMDGYRHDFGDCVPTSMRIILPTASPDGNDAPRVQWTLRGRSQATADEATPAITALGPIPPFRDGDLVYNQKYLGGSSVELAVELTGAYPPNPNMVDGADPIQLVQTKRSAKIVLNKVLKATLDILGSAKSQNNFQSFWAQWGSGAGGITMVNVPNARINFPNVDIGQNFVTDTVDFIIDDSAKAMSLVFPY